MNAVFMAIQGLAALATALCIGCLFYVHYKRDIKPDFQRWLAARRKQAKRQRKFA